MELSERFIQIFEKEGFDTVYEWQDKPGFLHEECSNQTKVSLLVTDGSLTYTSQAEKKIIKVGQRCDIAAHTPFTLLAGDGGAIYIIGEMSA